ERVVASVAREPIVSGVVEQLVVAVAAVEDVRAVPTLEMVVPWTAVRAIVAAAADQLVGALAAVEAVVPVAAVQLVVTAEPAKVVPEWGSEHDVWTWRPVAAVRARARLRLDVRPGTAADEVRHGRGIPGAGRGRDQRIGSTVAVDVADAGDIASECRRRTD